MSCGLLTTAIALLCSSSPVSLSPAALSPALEFNGAQQVPTSRAAAAAAAADNAAAQLVLWVNCDTGSDTAAGISTATALRSIARAQVLVRGRPASSAGALVNVAGLCSLSTPLEFTAADGGASASAPVIYRGLAGAVISGGRSPTHWTAAPWPGAPPTAVWSSEVTSFPIEIKSLRTSHGDWVQRSRWPRRVVGNYSTGWLALDASTSFNGPNTCPGACMGGPGVCSPNHIGPGTPPNNKIIPCWGGGFLNATNLGVDYTHTADGLSISTILPSPGTAITTTSSSTVLPTCKDAKPVNATYLSGIATKLETVGVGVAGLDACRALCCTDALCHGWTVAGIGSGTGGVMPPCVVGKPCCWLHGGPDVKKQSGCGACISATGWAPPPPPPVPPPPSPPGPPAPPPPPPPPPPLPPPPGPPPPHVPGYDWGPPTDLWVNSFSGDEKDCLNQIRPVSAVNFTGLNRVALVSSFWGAGVPNVSPNSQNPAQEGSGRFFLENVAAALEPGSFFVAGNCTPSQKHCGNKTGVVLFYWPAAGELPPDLPVRSPVAPVLFELMTVDNTSHIVFSNITFRDTSYAAEGGWNGVAGEPSDGAVRISNSTDIQIEASQFLAGIGGYAVRVGNWSTGIKVIGNLMAELGQGGVLLGNTNMNGIVPSSPQLPHNCEVSFNVMEDIGLMLKHVSGVGMRTARHNIIRHNRISRSPRYGISMTSWANADGSGWGQSDSNVLEFNIISDTALETNDVGAINFGGGGDANFSGLHSSPWNLNETVRYNNITRTVGAEARDGVHVCQGAKGGWGGEPRHLFAPDVPSDCGWATWSIYLDGGSPPAGGTSGVNIYQNIIDASTSGAVFVNGGGNVNITNNVILDGDSTQILIYSYNRAVDFGCPGTAINRNVFSFKATHERPVGTLKPVGAYGGFFLSPPQHSPGMCPISSTITGSDNNLFWNPTLGLSGTAAWPTMFGSVGVQGYTLAQWQASKLMAAGPMDRSSIIADPQFVDAAHGNYSLKETSPALTKLGFQPIPPINAPSRIVDTTRLRTDDTESTGPLARRSVSEPATRSWCAPHNMDYPRTTSPESPRIVVQHASTRSKWL